MFDFLGLKITDEVKTISPPSRRSKTWFDIYTWMIEPIARAYAWFTIYVYGNPFDRYSPSTAYDIGDFVVYEDYKVYMCTYPNTGSTPNGPRYWVVVCDSHIGLLDRLLYTPCRREFEYILNIKFGLAWSDDIEQNPIWIDGKADPDEQFWIGFTEDSSSYIEYIDITATRFITFETELDSGNAIINYPLSLFNTPDKVEALKSFANKIVFRSFTISYNGY